MTDLPSSSGLPYSGWPTTDSGHWPAPNGYHRPAPAAGDPGAEERTPPGGARNRRVAGRRRGGRIGGALGALGAFFAKYGLLLYKLKYLTVFASMLVSLAAYAWLFGWSFAAGFLLLLLVHEMGHALEMRRQGVPASLPMFVPFMGAVIAMRGRPASAYQEARIGLAGPAFGTAAAAVVALIAFHEHSNFLRALAFVGFLINLFNLFPVLPLDGGRAVGALHPSIWLAGLAGLLAFEIWHPSPLVVFILLIGSVELWRRWKDRYSPASRIYHDLSAGQRWAVGTAYVALVGLCATGMELTYLSRSLG